MAVERVSGGSSLIDVLDRVLDKGIVIDAWVRISLVGIDLITVEARVVVASIDTYLKYADAVGLVGLVSRPHIGEGEGPAPVEVPKPVAEEGLVDPEFSWHVGIRSTTYAQGVVPRALSLGYKVVSLDELIRGGFAQRMAEFRDKVGKRPVYLCFDMDVFDPSCAPGVCTPSWGGLSAREGIDLLRCLGDLNIVAVDVNTVSPPQDVNGMAAHLCAHVIYETLVLLCRQMGMVGRR